jgi:hypothetical protein
LTPSTVDGRDERGQDNFLNQLNSPALAARAIRAIPALMPATRRESAALCRVQVLIRLNFSRKSDASATSPSATGMPGTPHAPRAI